MPPTESGDAAAFFADWLLPLSRAQLRRGASYLQRSDAPDSFWGPVVSRSGGVAKLERDACDAQSLLAALDDYWARTDQAALRRLSPGLLALLHAPRLAGADDPVAVAEFVYPLF